MFYSSCSPTAHASEGFSLRDGLTSNDGILTFCSPLGGHLPASGVHPPYNIQSIPTSRPVQYSTFSTTKSRASPRASLFRLRQSLIHRLSPSLHHLTRTLLQYFSRHEFTITVPAAPFSPLFPSLFHNHPSPSPSPPSSAAPSLGSSPLT